MRAEHLRTSYLNHPIGIDERTPRFAWNCADGIKQSAYRIVVKEIPVGKVVWDSGKVESSSMTHITYEGEKLRSRQRCIWNVCLWDEAGHEGAWSDTATFEMGLLQNSDWTAKWISGDYRPKKNTRYPVDCFQKKFKVRNQKTVAGARLYASARGIYDVFINGKRIEEFILAPGITNYKKRIQYQTYDVTELLVTELQPNVTEEDKSFEQCIELRLADGWFRGSVAAYGVVNVFGMQTSIIAQLEIAYTDGSWDVIGTDSSFNWSNDGPIRFADLKDGEIYDASMKPGYSGKAIEVAAPVRRVTENESGTKLGEEILVASNNVAVRERERFIPTALTAKDGTKVLDFGQNIAGYLSCMVRGKKGQKVTLLCGEVLDEGGKVDMSGIHETRPAKGWGQMNLVKKLITGQVKGEVTVTPKQEITIICSGGADSYKTSFAVFGFRYAQVMCDGDMSSVDISEVQSIAVYSDMEQTGEFTCSNELVNKLVQNTAWSMKGNFLDIPTDCPTRERLGWTGDAQIFFETGAYLMDTSAFFRKWLQDMEDSQYKNGLIPAVIPLEGVEMMYKATGSSVGWADAIYLIPYGYYKCFGDKDILRRYWPMMRKYADYLMNNLGLRDRKEGRENPYNAFTLEKGVHLGEWLEPEEFRDRVYGTQAKHPEECTAYLYLTMTTMAEIADLIGEQNLQKKYMKIAEGAKKAYQYLVVDKGGLNTNRQAKLVRPLRLGVLNEEAQNRAVEHLVKAVEEYQYRVGTGFLSTPFILPVLTEKGHVDTAYRMLENTQKPGWLAEVMDGATTIWENWEGNLSQNHYSPGAVCQWLFETVAGIRVQGENHFVIAPIPGGTLEHAQASYQSPYGKVESSWRKTESGCEFTIIIPGNTTAEILLPDGSRKVVESGTYCFQTIGGMTDDI